MKRTIIAGALLALLLAAPAAAQTVTYSSFADLGNEIGNYSNVGTGDANTFVKTETGTRTDVTSTRTAPHMQPAGYGEVVGCPSFWGGWKRNVNPHTCLKPFNSMGGSHKSYSTVNTQTTTTKVLEYQFDAPDDQKVKITTTVNTVDAP